MRMTPQRLAICQFMSNTDAHPTAADVYRQLKPQFPSLSLMTVYNTLNALVGVGTVNALGMAGDDNVHYDGDTSPHVNLICLKCHRISDMDSALAEKLDAEIGDSSGFKVIGSRLVYYGLCPECQKSQNKKGEK
jgi:Fur family peroxide stress response transcriptional regulator